MKKYLTLILLALCLMTSAAYAQTQPQAQPQTMPDEALQKDYDNCMGGDTPQKDPQRAQYCDCVRSGMRQWTLDQYGAAATQVQQNQGQANAPPPSDVAALAKSCIDKVLR